MHSVELDIAQSPFVDLGYRLRANAWGEGLASEGALRCLQFAKDNLSLNKVYAIAPAKNTASIAVMLKIGMHKESSFKHPLLADSPEIETCDLTSRIYSQGKILMCAAASAASFRMLSISAPSAALLSTTAILRKGLHVGLPNILISFCTSLKT